MISKERRDRKGYWENELSSLGIEAKRQNDLNDNEELAALAENIKQVYYQDYKTAYSNGKKTDESRFDYII